MRYLHAQLPLYNGGKIDVCKTSGGLNNYYLCSTGCKCIRVQVSNHFDSRRTEMFGNIFQHYGAQHSALEARGWARSHCVSGGAVRAPNRYFNVSS